MPQDDPAARLVDECILLHWILAIVHTTCASWRRSADLRCTTSGLVRQLSGLEGTHRYLKTVTFLLVLSRSHCNTFISWSANISSGSETPDIQAELRGILENIESDASLRTSAVTIEQVLEHSYPWARGPVNTRTATNCGIR